MNEYHWLDLGGSVELFLYTHMKENNLVKIWPTNTYDMAYLMNAGIALDVELAKNLQKAGCIILQAIGNRFRGDYVLPADTFDEVEGKYGYFALYPKNMDTMKKALIDYHVQMHNETF